MKRININELIWFIILAAFAVYIYMLFDSGKISMYIHPRMFKYIYFSYVVFTILAIFQITKITAENKSKKIKSGYIIFLIPLLLAFVISPENLGENIISKKGINLFNSKEMYSYMGENQPNIDNSKISVSSDKVYDKSNKEDKEKKDIQSYDAVKDNEGKSESLKAGKDSKSNEEKEDKGIPQTDNDSQSNAESSEARDAEKFKKILASSYERLDEMAGKEVELSGFVYREPNFSKNQFVISRFLMVCCAADVQITGILCEGNDFSDITDNEWIRITGIIDSVNYKNEYTKEEEIIPLIKVDRVENINVPKNQYIYP